jgi:glycosyltransferase involved in cell wall biosynthesis
MANNQLLKGPRRIGVFYPAKILESVPIVHNIITMLAMAGYIVEVFIYKGNEEQPIVHFKNTRIIVHELQLEGTGAFLKLFPNTVNYFFWALKNSHGKQFSCFIGVDPPGLCVAAALGILFRVPWVYLSLEINLSDDPYRHYPHYTSMELWCSRRANLIIIQDERRAQLMAEDNGISMSRFVLLPNSPRGPARRKRTDYFKRKFGLTDADKILLHMGTIDDFTRCKELAQAAQAFPDHWKLILHSRFATFSDIINHLGQSYHPDKVIISADPVPYSMMDELVSSADIGIALYQSYSPNLWYTGKSSGKLCHYLHCGLPVITNRMPLWQECLHHYHSGICIDAVSDIRRAAEEIFADYNRFAQGALEHFKSELQFETAFAEVLERLPGSG